MLKSPAGSDGVLRPLLNIGDPHFVKLGAQTLAERPKPTPSPERSTHQLEQSARLRLERAFKEHHALVWRTVRRLGTSPEVAADVTQQAYLIAAERLSDIHPGCERSFIFTTALTLARTRHRRERRCELEDMDVRSAPDAGRDTAARHHYARQLLERVLARMDAELVLVFALFELEGVSTVEMAELFQVPLGTVASRLRRARELFRAEVARLEKAGEARGLS
jgi:RNA polymerase sigma-70 factor, ECF subfamily